MTAGCESYSGRTMCEFSYPLTAVERMRLMVQSTAVSKRYESQRATDDGRPRHYCYVDLGSAEEAADAAEKLDGMEWENKAIKVRVARRDDERRNPRSQAIRTGGSWR